MSQTATIPEKNGKPTPMSELERVVRENAQDPADESHPELHSYLGHCRGVIHVGAGIGQEREIYCRLPVVWVEALPMVCNVLREKVKEFPKQTVIEALVADGKPHKFGLANNACQSSSVYDLKGHRDLWPQVGYMATTEINSITLDDLIQRHNLDLDTYDALVLDVQGAELLVLKHAGAHLERFRWVQCEVADFVAYTDGCTLDDLDQYMTERGFVRHKLVSVITAPGIGTYYEAVYKNTRPAPAPATRLNLGAGNTSLPGFVNLDRKTGQEVYPLAYPDGSVDEIMACHVFEHFSHLESGTVLRNWVSKLKPGGRIRLAVPDFEILAKEYLAGRPLNVQGYVMGGHVDSDDRHGGIFDRESLTELMQACGLERIGAWKSETKDCSSLAISLNLQGFKPTSAVTEIRNLKAVYSTPRFGPLQHCRCIERATQALRFESKGGASCFWHQMLSVLMEEAIADESCQFVLTMDFDTIFGAHDVLELYRLMQVCPEADAIFPVQSKRGCTEALFSLTDSNGQLKVRIPESDLLERNLLPANTGHFGLTIFRAESLRKFPRPWMLPCPNKDGKWDDGQIDADITFWMRFKDAGFQPYLAPKVVVGHLQEIVTWPGRDLKPVYQKPSDYDQVGIPADVVR